MTCERYEKLIELQGYLLGQLAVSDGLDRTANPYPAGSDDYQAWMVGWGEATEGASDED